MELKLEVVGASSWLKLQFCVLCSAKCFFQVFTLMNFCAVLGPGIDGTVWSVNTVELLHVFLQSRLSRIRQYTLELDDMFITHRL